MRAGVTLLAVEVEGYSSWGSLTACACGDNAADF